MYVCVYVSMNVPHLHHIYAIHMYACMHECIIHAFLHTKYAQKSRTFINSCTQIICIHTFLYKKIAHSYISTHTYTYLCPLLWQLTGGKISKVASLFNAVAQVLLSSLSVCLSPLSLLLCMYSCMCCTTCVCVCVCMYACMYILTFSRASAKPPHVCECTCV